METLVDNLKINYDLEGEGKSSLLLLHGWGGNKDSWYPIFQHFKKKFKVVALDLPGFGKSDIPPTPFGILDYARIVTEFTKKIGLENPVIVGHSFGGSVAVFLAANFPQVVSKLVLVDASGIRTKSVRKTIINFFAKAGKIFFSLPLLSNFSNSARKKLYKTIGENDYITSGELKKTFVNIIKEDIQPLLFKISLPTLIIWGAKDKDTPLSQAEIFHENIAGSKLVVIPHTGHFSYLENPEMFNEEVEKFLKE